MGKQNKKSMSKVTAILLAVMMVVVFMPTFAFAADSAPAKDVKVYLSISNQGDIAVDKDNAPVTWLPVTAKDIDKDGKVTFDEALIAAHDTYFEGGAEAGYDQENGWVKKLWGVDDNPASYSFIKNDQPTDLVTNETVAADDFLVASINSDAVNYGDEYSFFNKPAAVLAVDEDMTFKLAGFPAMSQPGIEATPLAGVQIGFFAEGQFKPVQGLITAEDGSFTVSFDDPGEYIITAKGTVPGTSWGGSPIDCPIIAPVCLITVEKPASPMTVKANKVTASAKKTTTIKASKAFTVKKSVGKVTYLKKSGNAKITVSKAGKVTVKKGLKKGKSYTVKVNVTDSGNEIYKKTTKTVSLKVKIK